MRSQFEGDIMNAIRNMGKGLVTARFIEVCALSFWGANSLVWACFPLIVIDAIDNHYGITDYWIFIKNYDIEAFDVFAFVSLVFANSLSSYGVLKRWEKKGIKTVSYEESIFWMKFTTFLFFLIGMIWIVQKFVSEKIAILTFFSKRGIFDCQCFDNCYNYVFINRQKIERNCKCHI